MAGSGLTKEEFEQVYGPMGYDPTKRTEIHRQRNTWFLVQNAVRSPHPQTWISEAFASSQTARERALELLVLALEEGGNPLSCCTNVVNIAFDMHASLQHNGSLHDCPTCYTDAEECIRAAFEELTVLDRMKSAE